MKYIIEIAKEYEEYFKGILICGIAEGKFAVDVIAKEDLEELNSPLTTSTSTSETCKMMPLNGDTA